MEKFQRGEDEETWYRICDSTSSN